MCGRRVRGSTHHVAVEIILGEIKSVAQHGLRTWQMCGRRLGREREDLPLDCGGFVREADEELTQHLGRKLGQQTEVTADAPDERGACVRLVHLCTHAAAAHGR
jgi:hypothetical protein